MGIWFRPKDPSAKRKNVQKKRQSTSSLGASGKVLASVSIIFSGLFAAIVAPILTPFAQAYYNKHFGPPKTYVSLTGNEPTVFGQPKGCINWSLSVMKLLSECENGYLLSVDGVPEKSRVDFEIIPCSDKLNTYIILENGFMLFIGDGDRRSVILKKMNADGTWSYWKPDGYEKEKVFLPSEIPINHALRGAIDIDAKPKESGSREVELSMRFYDADGALIESGEITWNFTLTHSFDSDARVGIGLADPYLNTSPCVKINTFKVTSRD